MKINVFTDDMEFTTSEFDYCNIRGCFTRNTFYVGTVLAEKIDDDYSEFVPEKSNNGGCYGYSTYRIVEVIETEF